ncbi:MAG: hypothetical protein IPQ08_06185 [Chitinophagaceae bacterium]|nr:hypothetical protein [Chitinophagaceae bacterium]
MARPKKNKIPTATTVASEWTEAPRIKHAVERAIVENSFEADSEAQDKKVKSRRKPIDPLTDSLGEKGYYANARFEYLKYDFGGIRYPLEVSRFYEQRAVAFDFNLNSEEEKFVDLKKILFSQNKVKYFYCKDIVDLEKALQEIEKVN